jgi:class 3 adenylate cyclase/tetratricopeptide (TPR) repeat protein
MQCLACAHDNPERALACSHCGAALTLACPACGQPNAADHRFCGHCGAPLGASAPAGADPVAGRYTPAHLADKVLVSRSAVEGERKQVTVLFCDITGSTELTRRIGADAMHELLNRFFELALAEVHALEGTINQFLGDGFMALFGAPVAHEDHLRRALLAAQRIRERLREAGNAGPDAVLASVRIRMGVNTGPVVVGQIGDNLRMDYTAIGDTTNLAARLLSVATPGMICVSPSVHAGAQALFEFASLGEHRIKGIDRPVAVHELLHARSRAPATMPSQGLGIGSPLVGRDREMAAITSAIDALCRGEGSAFLMIGEPGAGKSRLLAEIRRRPEVAALQWLEGRSLSFGKRLSLWPFIEVLKTCFDIGDDATEAQMLSKLEGGLQALVGERASQMLPYLATVLALKVPAELDERVKYLDGPALKRQVYLCMRQLFEQLAQRKALVLVLEDWHWADASSLELAEHLLPLTLNSRLLVLFSTRTEPVRALEGVRRFGADTPGARLRETLLAPLSREQSTALIDNLVGGMALPAALSAQILRRTEGNPFFIEEVIRSLASAGFLQRGTRTNEWRARDDATALQLPDTLQGLILARIDRLDEDTKNSLKLASVIGRAFFDSVLGAIDKQDAALPSRLLSLEQAELIRDKQRLPEPEHIFKHALVQEAAYGSMLGETLRTVHRRVAQAVETLFADRLDEFASILAHHYTSAEDWDKAQEYLFKAGDQAGRIAADAEALEHFRQAEAAYLKAFGSKLSPLKRAALARKVGTALYGTGQYELAHAQMRQALGHLGIRYPTSRWGVRRAALTYLGAHLGRRLLDGLGWPRARTDDVDRATEVSTIAHLMAWMDYFLDKERMLLDSLIELRTGERSRHALAEARGLSSLGFALMVFGAPRGSLGYHHRALVAAQRSGDSSAIAFAWFAHGFLELYTGRWDSCEALLGRAVNGYRESGDIHRWGGATTILLLLVHMRGDLERAEALAAEQVRAGQDAGDPQVASWGLQSQAFPGLARGPLALVEARLREGQALARGIPSWDNLMFLTGLLAKCLVMQGRLAEAQSEVDEARAIIVREHLTLPFDQAEVLTAGATVAVALAEQAPAGSRAAAIAEALAAGRRAVACTRRMPLWLPQALRLQGTAHWLAGDATAAQRCWRESAARAERFGFPIEAGRTLLEVGQRTDDDKRMALALEIFRRTGAHTYRAQALHARARLLARGPHDAEATAEALRAAEVALDDVGARVVLAPHAH